MPYMNEREREVDRRIATLEKRVFGRVLGPDGTTGSREAAEAERRAPDPAAPTPYHPPKPGVNRAQRIERKKP